MALPLKRISKPPVAPGLHLQVCLLSFIQQSSVWAAVAGRTREAPAMTLALTAAMAA
jgi:hypothetical protein